MNENMFVQINVRFCRKEIYLLVFEKFEIIYIITANYFVKKFQKHIN